MLKPRLEGVLSFVEDANIVCDVGCDHGFLSIELIEQNKASKVYASDISIGPLNNAKRNIEAKHLTDKITCILSDGLKQIPDGADTVIIAGMGAYTAIEILENDMDRLDKYKNIIVQINSDMDVFRKWISDHHYKINKECLIDEYKVYTIIRFNTEYGEALDEYEGIVGPYLNTHKDEVFFSYYKSLYEKMCFIESVATKDAAKENAKHLKSIYLKAIEE